MAVRRSPPERLLRAALLQVVYSVRSERLLMEQMDYNLLFRWFVGLNIDDPVWDHSTFSFNRDRLFDAEIAQHFFQHTVLLARVNELVSDEHFSVDGTLLEAWVSHKSFRPKDGDDDGRGDDFRGRPRSNDTHASTTDPDARLMRKGKGKEAMLSYQASTLMENRNGIIVAVDVRHATGTSEREAALAMLVEAGIGNGATLGADKGYDTQDFVDLARSDRRACLGNCQLDGRLRGQAERPREVQELHDVQPAGSRLNSREALLRPTQRRSKGGLG